MSLDLPGFADPVPDAQAAFRAVLQAMSHPGRVLPAGAQLRAPSPLDPSTAAVLLALADQDTPLWIDPGMAAAREWIVFHCGCPLVALEAAGMAVALHCPDLGGLQAGSHEEPERGATLVLQVAAFGAGHTLRLQGPGLLTPGTLNVDGLPRGFAAARESRARFPRGIDIILCAGTALAALPRSTAVQQV